MAVKKTYTGPYGDVQDDQPIYTPTGQINTQAQLPDYLKQAISGMRTEANPLRAESGRGDAGADSTVRTEVQQPAPVQQPAQVQTVAPPTTPTAQQQPAVVQQPTVPVQTTQQLSGPTDLSGQIRERAIELQKLNMIGIEELKKAKMIAAQRQKSIIDAARMQSRRAELEQLANLGQLVGLRPEQISGEARQGLLQRDLSAQNQMFETDLQAQTEIDKLSSDAMRLQSQGRIDEANALIDEARRLDAGRQQAEQFNITTQNQQNQQAFANEMAMKQFTADEQARANQMVQQAWQNSFNQGQFDWQKAQAEAQAKVEQERYDQQYAIDVEKAANEFAIAQTKAAQDAADAKFKQWLELQKLSDQQKRTAIQDYNSKKKKATTSGSTTPKKNWWEI